MIAVAGPNLTLTGDNLDTSVEIRQLDADGKYLITPGPGTHLINGGGPVTTPQIVEGITGDITVDLKNGADTFKFLPRTGADGTVATGARSEVLGNLIINNGSDTNINVLDHVRVKGNLNVEKFAGSSGRSVLEIINGSLIQGNAIINNANGGAVGDSDTKIQASEVQGKLALTNGNGTDTANFLGATLGTTAGAPTVINNGPGNSITTFSVDNATGTRLHGGLTMTTAAATMNMLTFNQTIVDQAVNITNAGGANTSKTVVTNSKLGNDLDANYPTAFTVGAGANTDFSMKDSEAVGGLNIAINAAAAKTTTDLIQSKIGTHPLGPQNLVITAGASDDTVNLTNTTVGGNVVMTLGAGDNNVTLATVPVVGATPASMETSVRALSLTTGAGNDTVELNAAKVLLAVQIDLVNGVNTMKLKNGTSLGVVPGGSIMGGAGVNDTLIQDANVSTTIVNVTEFDL